MRKLGSAEFERDSQSGIRGQSRFLHGRVSSQQLSFLRLAARCCQHSADILWSERILPAVIGVSNGASRPLFSTPSAAARNPARQQPPADLLCQDDYRRLQARLAEAAAAHDCAVHAYVLMTNHFHLLRLAAQPEAKYALRRGFSSATILEDYVLRYRGRNSVCADRCRGAGGCRTGSRVSGSAKRSVVPANAAQSRESRRDVRLCRGFGTPGGL